MIKKVSTIGWNKSNLEEKIEDVDKSIRNTTKFIVIQDFNRITKLHFNARMTEASNNLKSKNQVENTLELGDKNKEKIKIFKPLI